VVHNSFLRLFDKRAYNNFKSSRSSYLDLVLGTFYASDKELYGKVTMILQCKKEIIWKYFLFLWNIFFLLYVLLHTWGNYLSPSPPSPLISISRNCFSKDISVRRLISGCQRALAAKVGKWRSTFLLGGSGSESSICFQDWEREPPRPFFCKSFQFFFLGIFCYALVFNGTLTCHKASLLSSRWNECQYF